MFYIIKNFVFNKITLFAALALVVGACTMISQKNGSTYDQFQERVGDETVKVILNAGRVSVAKVVPDENRNFIIDTDEYLLTMEQVKTLKNILLQDEGYHFDRKKRCLFIPKLAFMFGESQEVTVMVGTTCKQIKVIGPEKAIILDYDPMAQELNPFCGSFVSE